MASTPRFHVDTPLAPGAELDLPPNASRHVQVLRLQPGEPVLLFDGRGGQWLAEISAIGRKAVRARTQAHQAVERELPRAITLALGMPANERMDTVIEKAAELGASAIQPLVCERSVLRVAGERAERKAAHWQAVAVAACEQCGRNRVPTVAAPRLLREWLPEALPGDTQGWLLSLAADRQPLARRLATLPAGLPLVLLSGPEGGLSPGEDAEARARGFAALDLGARVLRADTAPLAALAALALAEGVAGG